MKKILNRLLYKVYSYFKYREKFFEKKFYSEYYLKKIYNSGEDCAINGKLEIISPENLHLGNNVHIGRNAFFDARGGLFIGDHTHISRNVTIYTSNPYYEGDLIPFNNNLIPGNVKIGKGVWIGMNVSILPGVNIGDGAIIGMGSVISKHVGECEIIVSQKQRKIGERNKTLFYKKLNENSIGGINGKPIFNKNFEKISLMEKLKRKEGHQICFVFSTGRSGSNSIASFLNKHENIDAYHEPFYSHFKVLSLNYLTGKISEEKVEEELKKIYSMVNLSKAGSVYVESDQKLVPFINILNKIFPHSKMIWLIREPSSFVKSAKSRGWFDKDDPEFFKNTVVVKPNFSSDAVRVTGDLVGMEKEEWEKLNQEEKLVWYWDYWNKKIHTAFNHIPMENKFVLKLNELESKQEDLLRFLELKNPGNIKPKKTNQVKQKHKKQYDGIELHNFKLKFKDSNEYYKSL